ncbi:carboxyl transferase domain-containing protein [Sporichthya brevicatena]|uniref:Carboxyl transferase domain-containing protein n=1 Tax=Sporichthya brevicatena TaxID=171442 RepID=A0ABN1GYH0_9ACTN
MQRLRSTVDPRSRSYAANRQVVEHALKELQGHLDGALGGGGPKYVERHRARGRMLPRERIELLVDLGSPLVELSPLAAAGTSFPTGASVVTAIGVVSGAECVIIANDPTVRGGAINPISVTKILRAMDICRENRLPLIFLVESGGADLPSQGEFYLRGGNQFRHLTQMSAAGVPSIALVFGNATAGGAYVPGMSDYTILIKGQSKVFLGGPPLVKMATGEDSDDETLGGAEMHARTSGVCDYLAVDEMDGIRIARDIVAHLGWRKLGPAPGPVTEPLEDPEELLGIASADPKVPFDVREVLARVVDGSEFDEFKSNYGPALICGWARIHGYLVGILANQAGVLFSEEAEKAAQFIQLANQMDQPLIFLHNCTGFIVGAEYERKGIVKDGAKMINAVANSTVPHIALMAGASYGAGNYGMSGRPYNPRFAFSWPTARVAVMGGPQLAGVLSIVARQSAASQGKPFDEAADEQMKQTIEAQIENESTAIWNTARIYDDGIIDPRDTRHVLGVALSATHSAEVKGAPGYGVFRM